jgi:hypothetical protein
VFMRPAHKLAGRACLLITPACGVFAPNSGGVFVVVRRLEDLVEALRG